MAEVEVPIANIPMPMDSAEGLQEFVGVGESNGEAEVIKNKEIKTPESEGWYKRWCRWAPTSKGELEESERKILSYIKTGYSGKYVDIGDVELPSKCKWSWHNKTEERKIWTLAFNEEAPADRTPVVVIHGLCAAAGLWALNMDGLADNRTVYAIDLLGFGKSSRPKFSHDASDAENQHIEAIEAWRKEMKLEKFVLLGHSMGGFLSSAYALKYPDSVAHLVLADPWGFPKKPENIDEIFPNRSTTMKVVSSLGQKINPLAVVRAAGPYGPGLIPKVRPDLVQKFEALNQDGSANVAEYIYHCNAQNPTGEEAFRTMMDFIGWAKNPMHNRIHALNPNMPLTMVYGEKTWLPQIPEVELAVLRPNGVNNVHTIPNAGHHVYADDQNMFNGIINTVSSLADKLLKR